MDLNVEQVQKTEIEMLANKAFAFMQRCRLNVNYGKVPNKFLHYVYVVTDITDVGDPFSVSFELTPTHTAEVNMADPADVEKFCYSLALKIGSAIFAEKAKRLLEHVEESKIIIPGKE